MLGRLWHPGPWRGTCRLSQALLGKGAMDRWVGERALGTYPVFTVFHLDIHTGRLREGFWEPKTGLDSLIWWEVVQRLPGSCILQWELGEPQAEMVLGTEHWDLTCRVGETSAGQEGKCMSLSSKWDSGSQESPGPPQHPIPADLGAQE